MLLDSIVLPDDLVWEDEFAWSPVVQSTGYSLTGALLIQENIKQKGRPITLIGSSDMGWVVRTTIESLETKRDIAGLEMTLTLPDARSFTVMFRQSDTPLDSSPVLGLNTYEDGEYFELRALRLMEV